MPIQTHTYVCGYFFLLLYEHCNMIVFSGKILLGKIGEQKSFFRKLV